MKITGMILTSSLIFMSQAAHASDMTGEAIYSSYCVGCHMTDGTGNGYCADFVNDRTRLAKTDEELILSVKHGMGNMPGYGWMLSDEDLQKVIQYIRDAFGDK